METMQRRAVLPPPLSLPLLGLNFPPAPQPETIFYSQSNPTLPLSHPEMTGISVIRGGGVVLPTLSVASCFLKIP